MYYWDIIFGLNVTFNDVKGYVRSCDPASAGVHENNHPESLQKDNYSRVPDYLHSGQDVRCHRVGDREKHGQYQCVKQSENAHVLVSGQFPAAAMVGP